MTGFEHPAAHDDPSQRKPRPVLVGALVVLAFIAALLFKAVVLDDASCAKASTSTQPVAPVELNERLMLV